MNELTVDTIKRDLNIKKNLSNPKNEWLKI